MKLFGKKTLALLLALSMVMSVCVFATETGTGTETPGTETPGGEGTGGGTGEGEQPAPPANVAVTGVTLNKESVSIVIKGTDTLTATVAPADATDSSVTFTSGNSSVATVSSSGVVTGVGVGTTTITVASVSNPEVTATCTVTVGKATISSAVGTATGSVPYGSDISKIKAKLPSSVEATLVGGAKVTVSTSELEAWTGGTYNETTKTYDFTTTFKAGNTKYITDGVAVTASVPAAFTCKLSKITMSAVIEGDGDYIGGLDEKIEYAIETTLGKEVSSSSISYDFAGGYYGSVNDTTGTYTVNLTSSKEEKLYEDGYLTDTVNYKATCGGVEYTGSIELTMYTTDVRATFTYAGGTLSTIASRIDAMMGGKMEAIEFEELELDGGVLWTDNKCDEEVYEDEYYTPTELGKMFYLPNGSGEPSYLSYVAYDDYDAGDGEVGNRANSIKGTIILYADEFLLLTGEITSEEVVELDGDTFEKAFLDLDKDYEYLEYVTFTKPASGDGYLYVEYDEDDSKHTSIGASTKYYVENDSKALIDDITYVPGKDTEGVVTIKFKATGYNDNKKKVTVDGVMQITVTVAADITIQAGKKQEVKIDPDLFLDFIEDVDTSNKDLEIISVAITDAPYQAKKGYLVTDGDELTKSGVKTFYADEDDVDVSKKKYDLYDLSFLGGTADGTVEATFKVTYVRENSTKNYYAEGTIDFVTGATSTHSLSGSIKASETMKFAASLSAFEDLGGNDNVYVTFTGLPNGGKLVYNWGTGSQEDVTVGTEYYLSYKAGKKLLSNVTFVPSYSSSKQARTISIPVKAYNSKEKAVTGTINITVNYAAYSSKFTDITTSTYADSVDFLYNQGITTGMTATTFGPNSNVTRAQFVTFLYRAAGQPAVTGVTNKFTDVKSTGTYAYAYNAILWAVQNNITTGRSATKFDPAANVTHQELLTFLYRYDVNYLGHPGTQGSLSGFIDASSLQSYAVAPAKWAAYKGIIDGYTLQPAVAGSRATVALWLHRMLTL